MEDQLISFETAKLARDKGFLEYVDNEYAMNGELRFDRSGIHYYVVKRANDSISIASAPTQSLLQRWLREVHNIRLFPIPSKDKYTYFIIYKNENVTLYDNKLNPGVGQGNPINWDTYETALEAGLLAALKLIK